METSPQLTALCTSSRELWIPDGEATGLCLPASVALTQVLVDAGFDARLCMGTFYLDDPDYPDDWEDEADGRDPHCPVHYWVQVSDFTCDITADQFTYMDECHEPLPQAVTVVDRNDDRAWRYQLLTVDPDYDLLEDDQAQVDRWLSLAGVTLR